ncbi:hypothetical protein KNO15_03075 [Leifsonia shinshuensis]|uniref:PH-like domain-containing protein n=1 Tax=Leifsonia shinshuensis TaxID=150026 RepID=UPI001F5131E0|nr:hypothetical protein [Leifsonia shinshuensis]MCI0155677.1 hypothetical protein [Leifsonia shinshuensis]
MDKLLPTIGILLVVIVVLVLAIVGWRRRVRRDAPAGGGYPSPDTVSAVTASAEVLYVATTAAGEPLERLALPGLAYRGRGTVEVSGDGVQLRVTGEQPVFIPAGALSGIGASTVAIDRVVERDGLLRLGWTTSGGAAADSYFRVVDPAGRGRLTSAVEDIIPAASTPDDSTEREV